MLSVLVAEEKEVVATRLAGQLQRLGHQVHGIVGDGPAAVASASRSRPDLVLLDQHLPPIDGIEVARAILAKHTVPLILMIGYPAAGLIRRAQEAGVLSYLTLPADTNELGIVIRVALARFWELRVLRDEVGDLAQALQARVVVERAKRLLMRRLDLKETDAFGYLRRQSRSTGKLVVQTAATLLATEELCFGKPDLVGCIDTILRVFTRREAFVARGIP